MFIKLCDECPASGYCEDEKRGLQIIECSVYDELIYQAHVEMEEYNRRYEPTYNPEDGSL